MDILAKLFPARYIVTIAGKTLMIVQILSEQFVLAHYRTMFAGFPGGEERATTLSDQTVRILEAIKSETDSKPLDAQFRDMHERRECHVDVGENFGGVFATVDDGDDSIDLQTELPCVFDRPQ